ncbi:MAG: hypothetical protein M1G31_04925 [Pseudanabaena sp. Salubria-1]|nr:hypothetical protein [Pseudanabaena sp. Salubria-1]MCX5934140.1 hypothetical protein [Pseudanabaena sp. LacPavin_0818_WC45_MAG_42_6]
MNRPLIKINKRSPHINHKTRSPVSSSPKQRSPHINHKTRSPISSNQPAIAPHLTTHKTRSPYLKSNRDRLSPPTKPYRLFPRQTAISSSENGKREF